MSSKLLELKRDFSQKQETLEAARIQLKKEFIGIDTVIDDVIDNVSSWFSLNQIQEKPLIINLWGLTGVGKSSLVNRLAELIDCSDKHYKLDMGEKEGRNSVKTILNELCENTEGLPLIITLDEFQNARTIKGPFRDETDDDTNRRIWELIDSGKIQHLEWRNFAWRFYEDINKLTSLVDNGVVVQNGIVVQNEEKFLKAFELKKTKKKIRFIDKDTRYTIYNFLKRERKISSVYDVKEILDKLDEQETLEFLNKAYRIATKPQIKDFSKSLIFILGNLDEAYSMSSDFNTDMNPDEFYQRTLKINIPKIKEALKTRFRNEQIARLGNIHIIYPSLRKKAYEEIIALELKKIETNLNKLTDIKVSFDQSINDVIYKEGVYPTLGVRPILTTINQIIKSKISRFINNGLVKGKLPRKIEFKTDYKFIMCNYFDENNELILEKKIEHIPILEKQRQNKKNDMQAITAVHESGHAILSAVLLKSVPEVIFSVTADAGSHGFVYTKTPWTYISKKEMINRTAMYLGGIAAEKIVFGDENITNGSSEDIKMATSLIAEMLKHEGFGTIPGRFDIEAPQFPNVIHKLTDIENEIQAYLQKGIELALKTLKDEKVLLLKIADYLSDNRVLKKEDFKVIVDEYATLKIDFIEDGNHIFYRKQLKDQCKSILPENVAFREIVLNKK